MKYLINIARDREKILCSVSGYHVISNIIYESYRFSSPATRKQHIAAQNECMKHPHKHKKPTDFHSMHYFVFRRGVGVSACPVPVIALKREKIKKIKTIGDGKHQVNGFTVSAKQNMPILPIIKKRLFQSIHVRIYSVFVVASSSTILVNGASLRAHK